MAFRDNDSKALEEGANLSALWRGAFIEELRREEEGEAMGVVSKERVAFLKLIKGCEGVQAQKRGFRMEE